MITHTPFIPNTEGFFSIPAELYHDHKLAPEISRSLVVDMGDNCPFVVKEMIDGRIPKKITKAMDSGTLVDLALLEPDRFREGVSHWVLPEGLDLRTKDGVAWRKDHPDLPVLKFRTDAAGEASVSDIAGMIESIMAHRKMRYAVENSVKQESAFCFHPDTGLLRKCRPDMRVIDRSGLTLLDLKSTMPGGTNERDWPSHCANMRYFIQSEFYSDIYRDLIGEEPFFEFCVVERKYPYLTNIFQIHEDDREEGRKRYRIALERYAECKASGIWPKHSEEIKIVRLPRWTRTSS